MKLLTKFAVFGVLCALVWGIETYWLHIIQSGISRDLAIRQLNGDDHMFDRLRAFDSMRDIVHTAGWVTIIIGGYVVFTAPPSMRRRQLVWPML